ncbi:MAG: MBL fold metallo-hydrolase, partial [Longimicrobiales bacterium]|nr:MBL fold metallo-hydrolase [Longimicrobiales bacterium]
MTSLLPEAPEYTAEEIARILEAGKPLQVMDVRAPEQVRQGRIDLLSPGRFHNTPGSQLIRATTVAATGLDPDLPVAVVCGMGKDSKVLASHLGRMGLDARSLRGGLVDWFSLTLPRVLDPPQTLDRLIQFDRIGKGCLGYLLISQGEALIIDPPLRAEAFLKSIEDVGATLVGVADTHVHADYVSGASSLSQRFGVPYYLHPADAVYPYDGTAGRIAFQAVAEGYTIPFGEAALNVVHTPGHTEGSVTFTLEDRVAFTGDFLFVESIGRPDLGGKEEEWAIHLWESLVRVRAMWSPGTAVYPAHYASERERRLGQAVGCPLGPLLESNPALKIQDRDEFIRFILGQKAPFPEHYRKIQALNVGLAPIVQTEVNELEVGRNECALG